MVERFRDRLEAGRKLATLLSHHSNRIDLLVFGLPRGGVPVAFGVAQALGAPLDVFVVRKLGVPGHEELAMGAIASGDVVVLNHEVVRTLGIPDAVIEKVVAAERQELRRREHAYRDDRPPIEAFGRTAILIDDGLATGSSMRAAIASLRRQRPACLVVAVPVAAPESCEEIRAEVDEMVCARTPDPVFAISYWYEDFAQTTDDEVRYLLALAARQRSVAGGAS